jgi:hypothetical protein
MNDNPVSGVTVYAGTRTPTGTYEMMGSVMTGVDGMYVFPELPKDVYRVWPQKTGCGFMPVQHFYSPLDHDMDNQDFESNNWEFKSDDLDKNFIRPVNNVFNPKTGQPVMIQFNIKQAGMTTINIYNLEGTLVKTVMQDMLPAGPMSVYWYGDNVANNVVSTGIYLVRIDSPGYKDTKKICVIK